ncbi:MAG: hypothetical protein MUF87_05765 [Anaerolineae bacterium]|jgi:hypothetical protein|nr:hypothetical protein [Anaerolineae bacterium]
MSDNQQPVSKEKRELLAIQNHKKIINGAIIFLYVIVVILFGLTITNHSNINQLTMSITAVASTQTEQVNLTLTATLLTPQASATFTETLTLTPSITLTETATVFTTPTPYPSFTFTPSVTPTPTLAILDGSCPATVRIVRGFLSLGPGSNYPPKEGIELVQGQTLGVLGFYMNWYQVYSTSEVESIGWIPQTYVDMLPNCRYVLRELPLP